MQLDKSSIPLSIRRNIAPPLLLLLSLVASLGRMGRAVDPQAHTGSNALPSQYDAVGETQMVELINQARTEHGVPPLTVDNRLTLAARKHSQLMAKNATLSHQFDGEPPPQIRFIEEGLPSDSASENVALNNRDVAAAHDGLMHSPPHLRAILDPTFNVVGVGVVRSGDQIYVTEDFAHKLPEYSEPQAEAVVQSALEKYARMEGYQRPERRTELQLRRIACAMARTDKLDSSDAMILPGVHNALVWTSVDPAKLPKGLSQVMSQRTVQYSLGACFAPSVSHPGGVYWLAMVMY
jgi:hypothetical protein